MNLSDGTTQRSEGGNCSHTDESLEPGTARARRTQGSQRMRRVRKTINVFPRDLGAFAVKDLIVWFLLCGLTCVHPCVRAANLWLHLPLPRVSRNLWLHLPLLSAPGGSRAGMTKKRPARFALAGLHAASFTFFVGNLPDQRSTKTAPLVPALVSVWFPLMPVALLLSPDPPTTIVSPSTDTPTPKFPFGVVLDALR